MKRLLLILTLLCAVKSTLAQGMFTVYNNQCNRKDTLVLFYSMSNELVIVKEGLRNMHPKIYSPDSSCYITDLSYRDDTAWVSVEPQYKPFIRFCIKDVYDDEVIVGYTIPVVKWDYSIRVGNIRGGAVTRARLLQQQSVECTLHPLYKRGILVRRYTFKAMEEGQQITLKCEGNMITDEVRDKIRYAPRGSWVEFTDILLNGADSKMRRLKGIRIQVK